MCYVSWEIGGAGWDISADFVRCPEAEGLLVVIFRLFLIRLVLY